MFNFIYFSVEELGIKEHLPAYLQPSLDEKELPTGVSFASGGSGFDPQTPKLVVICKLFLIHIYALYFKLFI